MRIPSYESKIKIFPIYCLIHYFVILTLYHDCPTEIFKIQFPLKVHDRFKTKLLCVIDYLLFQMLIIVLTTIHKSIFISIQSQNNNYSFSTYVHEKKNYNKNQNFCQKPNYKNAKPKVKFFDFWFLLKFKDLVLL